MSALADNPSQTDDVPWWDPDALAAANIMPATGLATDYLNVFNEAIMLFGLLPDMPDMIDELKLWEPLSYPEHFARSGFQAKGLAIAAYENADPAIRGPFDALSQETCTMLQEAIAEAGSIIGNGGDVSDFVQETSFALQSAIMLLDGMVHGGQQGGAQDDIDALFD
jgi:hypothetical protein